MEWTTVKLFRSEKDNEGNDMDYNARISLLGNDIEEACIKLSEENWQIFSTHTYERWTVAAIIIAWRK